MHTCDPVLSGAIAIAAKTALILETNNLRGGRDAGQALASLRRLIERLREQTLAPSSLAQWIITHDGLDAAACAELVRLAACPIDFVAIDPADSYYTAKNRGFDATDTARCRYVAFCDADCNPAPDWLEHLLLPFAAHQGTTPRVVAGRTSYREGVLGVALTSIDFMYFPTPLGAGYTANFYANNVAFQRDVFDKFRYQELDGVYRAHCQVMGMRLRAAGIAIAFAFRAHTVHRLPDSRRELLKLRWMRGEDSVSLAPYLVHSYAPSYLQWLARSGPFAALCIMAMRLFYSARTVNSQGLSELRGLGRPAALAAMTALSAIDSMGALIRGVSAIARRRADREQVTLSYHH